MLAHEGHQAREASSVIRIGISGWNYPAWRGVFFPRGLVQRKELAFASRQVDTIEVNGSFYSLLRPASVARWYRDSPDGFVFSLKGSRFITHMKRLNDVATPLANFFASGLLALGDKLGPILWQLPPSMAFDPARLAGFLDQLPRTTHEAAVLARSHDHRLDGRAHTETGTSRPLRYAVEVRHPSFQRPELVELLRRYGVALCVADTAGLFPDFEDVTADFVYVRLHGDTKLYESGYTPRALRRWSERITAWAGGGEIEGARRAAPASPAPRGPGRDVYVYFDNDAKVRAPFDARRLRAMVRGERTPRLPARLDEAGEPARTQWPDWRPAAER
jgi:uncharacterized protein YecE (DUF72 family)